MTATVKQLRIRDLIFNRRGSLTFRIILGFFDIALKLFFRRIETVNADTVPEKGGLIFVLNHPNGLVDPALVFVTLPRKISFLAKSTLFRMPVISSLLKMVEALPLYRKIDAGEDVSQNQKTFQAARALLKRGGSIALFPEGVSHNSPTLLPIKTGAARIALGAASVGGDTPVEIRIVPVGMYYTSKTTFRSEAMLYFGEAFPVERAELDEDGQPEREAVKELTQRIENALREVTLNAGTESELASAHAAERILTTSDDVLAERFDFLKAYIEEKRSRRRPEGEELRRRVAEYDAKLARRGLEAEHLSLAQLSKGFVVRQALVQTLPLIILLPLSVIGIVLHFPAYQLCKLLAAYYTHHGADDIVSTVKVLAAMLFMPLTWLVLAGVLTWFYGWQIGLIALPFGFVSGYAALYTVEEIAELSGWAKAIWLYLTDRDGFLRLFVERRDLQAKLRVL